MSDEYPKMLLREGSEIEWEGAKYDTLIVADADELAAAKKDGWKPATEVHDKAEETPRRGRQRKADDE